MEAFWSGAERPGVLKGALAWVAAGAGGAGGGTTAGTEAGMPTLGNDVHCAFPIKAAGRGDELCLPFPLLLLSACWSALSGASTAGGGTTTEGG